MKKALTILLVLPAAFLLLAVGSVNAADPTFTFPGGSLTTTNTNSWGGYNKHSYGVHFNVDAGPVTVEYLGVNAYPINYTGDFGWPPDATDTGASIIIALGDATNIAQYSFKSNMSGSQPRGTIPETYGKGSWDHQNVGHWNDDGYRSYLFQGQFTGHWVETVGNSQYNAEKHGGPTGANPDYDTFDFKMVIEKVAANTYQVTGWHNLWKSSAIDEGCPWDWNYAKNAHDPPKRGYLKCFEGTWTADGGLDLSNVQVFLAIQNWAGTQPELHTFDWDAVAVTGTVVPPPEVWVDGSWAGKNSGDAADGHTFGYDAFATIQNGVDAVATGGTVHVAAGTYDEQVVIDSKGLTLQGVGDGTIIQPSAPSKLTTIYTYPAGLGFWEGATVASVVLVKNVGGAGVTIQNLKVDGTNVTSLPSGSERFDGILYGESAGQIKNVCVNSIKANAYHDRATGIALASVAARTVEVTGNHVTAFARNGIQGVGGGLTVNVNNNVVTGPGTIGPDQLPNGMVFINNAGSVRGNTINALHYSDAATSWRSLGIMQYTTSPAGLIVENNEVFDADDGIYVHNDAIVRNNYLHGNGNGIEFEDGSNNNQVLNNTITGNVNGIQINGATNPNPEGKVPPGAGNVAHGNNISGNTGYGILSYDGTQTFDALANWWGAATGPYDNKTLPNTPNYNNPTGTGNAVTAYVDYKPWYSGNIVCDPDPEHLNAANPTKTIAVRYLGGGGGAVYGYSVKFSWNGAVVSTGTSKVTEGSFLSSQSSTQFFKNPSGTNEITVDCALLGNQAGVSTPGTLFTVEFTGVGYGTSPVDITIISFRNNQNQALTGFSEDDGEIQVDITNPVVSNVLVENLTMYPITGSNEYAKNTDDLKLTATVTDDYSLGTSNIVANLSSLLVGGGTAVPAESYSGGVATWQTVLQNVNLTADGLKTVTVTATDGLGNTGSGSDDITVDNTAPTKVLGLRAQPSHQKVILTWTDASSNDAHYKGVLVRYRGGGTYPTYGTLGSYPTTHTSGDGDACNVTSGATGTHSITTRDIYYYSAFAYDWAGNYSVVDGDGQDRATNYYLGDVSGVSGYDGYVEWNDLALWSFWYFSHPTTMPQQEGDFGPTVASGRFTTTDGNRLGIPQPDGVINFEDLMIFALNYHNVAPKLSAPANAKPAKEFALELQGQVVGDEMLVTVHLANDGRSVKGTSILLRYDPVSLVVKEVTGGTLFGPLGQFAFFAHKEDKETVQMDAAALGVDRTVDYSGDIGTIRFKVLKSGETGLRFDGVKARNGANEELTIQTKVMDGASTTIPLPTTYDLAQNYPNPFNPTTTIAYQVPEVAHVTLEVYNVLGERVAMLVDEQQATGYYRVEWNGKDSGQRSVSSGVYYYKMSAGQFTSIKKMLLVK